MPGLLVVNPGSGSGSPSADDLRAQAEQRGIRVRMVREGENPAGAAAEALDETGNDVAVGAAGGDGTLSGIASVCIDRDLQFVPVPFGTRNHFARDAGIDRGDPVAALDLFEAGVERRVDVGRVNGRLFLNNVSLGLYAGLVHHREHHRRRRLAWARLRALALAATQRQALGLTVDGEAVETHVLLVANNRYVLDVLSIGERERLDEGLLHLYVLHGWTWEERSCDRLTVAAAGALEAAIDGEPVTLETPLEFRCDAGALRLLAPAAPER